MQTVKRILTILFVAVSIALIPTFAQAQTAPDPHAGHNHDHEVSRSKLPANPTMAGALSKLPTDHAQGNVNAPVTLILYASVTCPHCAAWFQNDWPKLKSQYVDKGKVQFIFREYPTGPIQLSVAGFQIANCASKNDFFKIVLYQMQNQKDIFAAVKAGKGEAVYLDIAKMAGLNSNEEMMTCLQNKPGLDRLQHSSKLADDAGLRGVPSAIINGSPYEGKLDFAGLSRYLDGVLGQ